MPWLSIQAGLGGACALKPPWAPAASSPVAAAPSPPVTQGPRRRRRLGRRQGLLQPLCSRQDPWPASRAGWVYWISCPVERPKLGVCPFVAASELFPPRIWSGGLERVVQDLEPILSALRASRGEGTAPGTPSPSSAVRNPRLPRTFSSFLLGRSKALEASFRFL